MNLLDIPQVELLGAIRRGYEARRGRSADAFHLPFNGELSTDERRMLEQFTFEETP